MSFMDLVNNRFSCRAYTGESVSRDELTKIVEAGAMAPSGCNAQPWKFIVVDEADAKEKVCDALVLENGGTGAPWRNEAGAFIIAVEEPAKVMPMVKSYYNDTQRFAQGDIGMAVLNMLYRATELGLNTCVIGMCDQKKMQDYFGVPAGHEVRMVVAVGHGKDNTPTKKVRKSFEDVCSFNSY